MRDKERDILIVGGGPAGMMAGLLFARAGLNVAVLEKHADFFRDFRVLFQIHRRVGFTLANFIALVAVPSSGFFNQTTLNT